MGASCCDHCHEGGDGGGPAYRRVLWAALAINLAMFAVEIGAGLGARSVSLLADSLDFLGDAANYGVSLLVLGLALRWRARAALLKGATMLAFGLWVVVTTVQHTVSGALPDAPTMGAIGLLAIAANLTVAGLLYRHRDGDSNMVSVWICTRNDAIGNLMVLAAALGVLGTGIGWPDFIVGAVMAALALSGAWRILRQALAELRSTAAPPTVSRARPGMQADA
ncbi:cation transporter [Enhydrobacter sp.]|jgi:cation diffusion facilitator family transporter|uniref:cation transporter n=1 Tax=Enhydrobacter sp. TaxID=1894999 RepID=UPI002612407A|nr:cation transporter [Enhydrobacter sp.]WIM09083.1 MAG: Cobalt/zinc/cadmium resistance protein CzcD [Enhydrobacter sp.]